VTQLKSGGIRHQVNVTLVSGDFVRTGGMDMPNFALAQYLADRGANVHIVAYRIAQELAQHPRVTWHRVPKPLNSYLLGAPFLDRAGRRVARSVGVESRIVANGGNCLVGDVNWVHYVHAAYRPTVSGGVPARAKALVTRRIELHVERAALGMARLVIANSERTRHHLTTLLGVDDARIRTVYYGIDRTRFVVPTPDRRQSLREQFGWPDRPQLVFVGALGDRRKGFDTLYAAWVTLCRSTGWDCDLVVVGQGAELAQWQARARADGLGERIRFLGFRRDVHDVLAAADALVAPTRYEAFGLGVQEALCTGLPALVTAHAGVAERYPQSLSELLIADPDSVNELVKAILNWRHRTSELSDLTRQLSTKLRERTWDTMSAEIDELLSR
jgi:glycosyltransferase involved in cell wall biosynthesis